MSQPHLLLLLLANAFRFKKQIFYVNELSKAAERFPIFNVFPFMIFFHFSIFRFVSLHVQLGFAKHTLLSHHF